MKIYLAAQYPRLDEMSSYARRLQYEGFYITSKWCTQPDMPADSTIQDYTEEHCKELAIRDFAHVAEADIVLFFAEKDRPQPPRGSRHVEFGYALGRGIPVLTVGPYENFFHYHPDVTHVNSFEEALKFLRAKQQA